jgi:hypothetical protein
MDHVCFGSILGLVVIGLARFVLGPLFAEHCKQVRDAEFQVLDLASLMWLLSMAWGAAGVLLRQDFWGYPGPDYPNNSGYRILLVSGSLLASCLWWLSIRTANRAGIGSPTQRVFISAVLFPVTYAALALACTVWVAGITEAVSGAALLSAYLALAALLVACHCMARRIGRGDHGPEAESQAQNADQRIST